MSEPTYTPNSHKYIAEQKAAASEEKRVAKVVKGPVKTKKNEMRKFADIFISEDAGNVKNYIFMDVLVPAIKKTIYDIITNGIDVLLYGGTGRAKSGGGASGTKVSYSRYYDQKNNNGYRGSENVKSRNGFEYDDIIFGNRGEAEAVKQQMQATIAKYGVVTVADMYDMADLSAPYTSQKYGWMDVSGADAVRNRDGYTLRLPRPVPID